jgi:ketosteroid isomerase-like protein
MSHQVESILSDIYDAWRAHNLDLLASYLPDDFSHFINIPTELHPLREARHGKAAVLKRLNQIFEQFDTEQLEISAITVRAEGASVQVQTRCQHRQSGAVLDITKSNLGSLEHGWPVKLFEHYDLERFKAFMQNVGASPGV